MRHSIATSIFRKAIAGILPLLVLSIFLPAGSMAQNDGKKLFEKHCTVCHKLGEGKLVGPELVGITKVREREWLVKFIRNSKELIDAGDPVAVKVFEENNKIPMQAFTNLSDAEINGIIDYIENWEPPKAQEFTADVNKKEGFTETEILRGERMFYGLIPFENGGTTACNSCHYTKNSDSLNWSPSAIDLAHAFMEKDGMNIYASMSEPASSVMEKPTRIIN